MILKIESIYTQFTLDLIFILYSLFQQTLIDKPFASNSLSEKQYVFFK